MKKAYLLFFLLSCMPYVLPAQIISFDPNYGNGGVFEANTLSGYSLSQMEVAPDGSVIFAYEDNGFGWQNFVAQRYLSDGSVDTNFGNNGLIQFNSGNDYDFVYISEVKLLPNSTLLFLFETNYHDYNSNHSDLLLFAFDKFGNFLYEKDIDFYDESHDVFYGIEAYGNNYRVAGYTNEWQFASNTRVTVNAYTAAGGNAGGNTEIPMNGQAYHTADLPGSQYLIAGRFNGQGGVIRRTGYNSYDTNFGNNGFAIQDGSSINQIYTLTNGQFLAVGNNKIYKLHPDGSPDLAFANNGILSLAPFGSFGLANWQRLSIFDDGRFLFAKNNDLYQFLPDGTLNPDFGDNGVFNPQFNGEDLPMWEWQMIGDSVLMTSGKVNGGAQVRIARYNLEKQTTDIGAQIVTGPNSGVLSDSETISVKIRNYGTETQDSYTLGYRLNSDQIVTEDVDFSLAPGATYTYTFSTPADFSEIGLYEVQAFTSLGGDTALYNDSSLVVQIESLPPYTLTLSDLVRTNICEDGLSFQFNLKNQGGLPLTAVGFDIYVDSVYTESFEWTGSLNFPNSTPVAHVIDWDDINQHEVRVEVTSLNGQGNVQGVANISNTIIPYLNTGNYRFVYLSFLTDMYPGETSWAIRNELGQLIKAGGPYPSSNQYFLDSFCLAGPSDCFTLHMQDTYGDGLLAELILTNSSGTEILVVDDFDSASETYDFCVACLTAEVEYANINSSTPLAGTIQINLLQGGTASTMYSIDGGQNFQADSIFTDLEAGTYQVFVLAENGCSWETTVEMQSCSISVDLDILPYSDSGSSYGWIHFMASGTTGTTQYSINGGSSFSNNPNFNWLGPGTYSLVVKDAGGCTWTATAVIPYCGLEAVPDITAASAAGAMDGTLFLNLNNVSGPAQYSINNGLNYQADPFFDQLAAGTYTIRVKDSIGCVDVITVAIPTCSLNSDINIVASSVFADNGKIIFLPFGNMGDLLYSIDGGQNYQSSPVFSGLAPGTYNLQLEDAYGCIWTGQAVVATGPQVLAEVEEVQSGTENPGETATEVPVEVPSNSVLNIVQPPTLSELRVWPNPVTTHLQLQGETHIATRDPIQFQVFDVYGRLWLQQTFESTALAQSISVDISKFVSGTYIWVLEFGQERRQGRLIKE